MSPAKCTHTIRIRFHIVSGVLVLLTLTGCNGFFDRTPTQVQNERIFHDLSRVRIVPDVDRPLPEIYTAEPKILPAKSGVNLFYFTRHHPPATLAELIRGQLHDLVSAAPSAKKGSPGANLMVDENPATNQLIVRCETAEDARLVLAFLEQVDVPPIQVRVDCLISELFADLTMDYETKIQIENLLGEAIAVDSLLPGASLRSVARSDMGLKTGITKSKFSSLMDVLESRGYAKVLMRPSVEVVNGRTAKIEIKERLPTAEKILSGSMVIDTVKYQDIMDYLEVTPQVYADGTIGLKTSAGISSKTPDGVEQVPILTERQITNDENRLRKGQSLIIGGIIKTEQTSVIRGVPLLQDLPGLGVLFSAKDYEDRVKEILFILTPSISANGTDHPALIAHLRDKHLSTDGTIDGKKPMP